MKYVMYILLIAVIFGLVALCDWGLKKLFPRLEHSGEAVRMPRYSFILGILLTVFGVMALLYVPRDTQKALWFGCWVVVVIGVYLLVNFFWTGIFYDDEGFTYRAFPHRARTYTYGQITGQRTFAAKNGWNANLYVNGDEVQLYSAMQGLSSFLNRAFYGWCRQRGIDPDTVETDPRNLIYFPDPDDTAEP